MWINETEYYEMREKLNKWLRNIHSQHPNVVIKQEKSKRKNKPLVNMMNREMLINEVLDSRKKLKQKTYTIKKPENPIQRQRINWLGYVAIFILGYCVAMMVTAYNNTEYQSTHHCTPINIDRG